jgi:MFS transporter, FHS family, glucose/mannose:H+ symporter
MRRFDFLTSSKTISARAVLIVHLGFLLTGTVTTLLGPMLPALSNRWVLNDAQAGYLFTAQFIGSLVGVLLSGKAIARIGTFKSLAVGFAMMAVATTLLGAVSFAVGLTCVAIYGVGLGLTIPVCNLLIAEVNPARSAESLNFLNFVWGLGAVLSPPLIGPLAIRYGPHFPLLGLAVLLATISVALFSLSRRPTNDGTSVEEIDVSADVWRNPLLFLIALSAFLYVGTENGISGWLASYGLRSSGSQSSWSLLPSVFWSSILIGRAGAPAILKWLSPVKLILAGLVISAIGSVILLSWLGTVGLLLGAFLAGFGLAPVFPTTIAILTQVFGKATSRVSSLVFVLAALGGATVPWLVGVVSTRYGSLRIGLLLPLLITLLLLLLHFTLSLMKAQKNQSSS